MNDLSKYDFKKAILISRLKRNNCKFYDPNAGPIMTEHGWPYES